MRSYIVKQMYQQKKWITPSILGDFTYKKGVTIGKVEEWHK